MNVIKKRYNNLTEISLFSSVVITRSIIVMVDIV